MVDGNTCLVAAARNHIDNLFVNWARLDQIIFAGNLYQDAGRIF